MSISKQCKLCGAEFTAYTTIQNKCFDCSKKTHKPIRQQGKHANLWKSFKKKWLQDNPPPHVCGICNKPIRGGDLVLDHIQPRSGSPNLRYDKTNIQTAHYLCNDEKGSKRV